VDKFCAWSSSTETSSDKHYGKTHKDGCDCCPHHFTPCNAMLNMTAHFEKLYVFTDILNSGQYDPVQHLMPPGYVKYCVLVQHDLEECVPFPPSVNPTTTTVDDCEVCTIAATTHATSVEAIDAQDELVDDLCRGHADQHHHRGPNRRHSHSVGEGQRAM
jgi:hypothetical protein